MSSSLSTVLVYNKTYHSLQAFILFNTKDVREIAMGIGPAIDQSTLLSIAGKDGQVVEVEDFSQLENMMNIIKSKFTSASPFLLTYTSKYNY